jgi:hypothetical protein
MQPALSVHDNTIYAYSVDCEHRRLVLHTAFPGHESAEYVDLVFRDVVAHHFEHVLPSNILFDVKETEIAAVVRENEHLLADSWRYGWPPVEYDGNLAVLVETLNAASARAYSIGSSYGLSGWVFAGSCERVSRSEPARLGQPDAYARRDRVKQCGRRSRGRMTISQLNLFNALYLVITTAVAIVVRATPRRMVGSLVSRTVGGHRGNATRIERDTRRLLRPASAD